MHKLFTYSTLRKPAPPQITYFKFANPESSKSTKELNNTGVMKKLVILLSMINVFSFCKSKNKLLLAM